MKKILLATALAAVSISATEANWGGFYARGGLAANGAGVTNKKDDKAVAGDEYKIGAALEIAAGWGMTVANVVYLGVDAQVANFGIDYNTSGAEGATTSTTKLTWAPSAQVRVGYAGKSVMPYIAGGFGYSKVVSDSKVVAPATLPEGNMTWSARLGSDFKVSESFFVGVYGQFVKAFNTETGEGELKTAKGTSATTVGFTAGYQF
ncbi:MAG: outer membrane beta-barrel protein [Alphaproteobacteria bacterium]|nr:outer membrane beta-barrel protein [Alphaproteobacteria bacterium]